MFMASSVEYLGHLVNVEGFHLLPEKVRAIQDAPELTKVSELKSVFELLSYYSRFCLVYLQYLAPCMVYLSVTSNCTGVKAKRQHFLKLNN